MVQATEPREGEVSILLACQRTMTSELYEQAFNSSPGFRVVARAQSVEEALQAAKEKEAQVALISCSLRDGPLSGFTALQQVQEAHPSIRSVILIEHDEGHLVTAAFRAGAKGVFFPATSGFESLCRCVKQVSRGQIWANSAQLQEVLDAFSRHTPIRIVSAIGEQLLTKREEDIVYLVQDGLTNRQIAVELGLSEHTVRNNLFRIFDKLGVSTRVELALYAINNARLAAPKQLVPEHKKDVVAERPSKGKRRAEATG